jgi:ribosomal protein L37AE/L43A
MKSTLEVVRAEKFVLKKKDDTYFFRSGCPFCHSKKAAVYPLTGVFRCRKCNFTGSQLAFIMKLKNLDFIEGWKHLKTR